MIRDLLKKDEGKTLEFKENSRSKTKIIRTIVAFANTAGGTLIIGVRDKTKEIIGVSDALLEEEKISNMIADCIKPALIPDIKVKIFRQKERFSSLEKQGLIFSRMRLFDVPGSVV